MSGSLFSDCRRSRLFLEYLLQLAAEGPDTISNRTFPLFRDFGEYPGLHLGILVDDS